MQLVEVILDLGRPPLARFPGTDLVLSEGLVSREDLDHAISQVSAFGTDNRAGIERTLHRVSPYPTCMPARVFAYVLFLSRFSFEIGLEVDIHRAGSGGR